MSDTCIRKTKAADQLTAWIERSCLQYKDAAALLKIHPSTLAHYLSGRRTPSLAQGVEIQRRTGVTVEAWTARKRGKAGSSAPKVEESAAHIE